MKRLLKLASLLILCSASTAFAHEYQAGPITIDHPWSRATVPAVPTGAVYFVLRNPSLEGDRLISVNSTVAEKTEIHTHVRDGEMLRMRQIEAIDIGPASTVALAPGGLHIMLMKLKQPLVKGQRFALDLGFERAGSVTVQVEVQDISTPAHTGHGHGHGHGHDHGRGTHHSHKH